MNIVKYREGRVPAPLAAESVSTANRARDIVLQRIELLRTHTRTPLLAWSQGKGVLMPSCLLRRAPYPFANFSGSNTGIEGA